MYSDENSFFLHPHIDSEFADLSYAPNSVVKSYKQYQKSLSEEELEGGYDDKHSGSYSGLFLFFIKIVVSTAITVMIEQIMLT